MTSEEMNKILLELRSFKSSSDDDNIKFKEKIKKQLLENKCLIHALHNIRLDEDDPDTYYGVNIRPYLVIPETQTEPKNFLCFKSNFEDTVRYNEFKKVGEIQFAILCPYSEIDDKETGIARHDLIAAIIKKQFNYTNIFGSQIVLTSDKETTVDGGYAMRTLIFELKTPNNILKNGRVINKSEVSR